MKMSLVYKVKYHLLESFVIASWKIFQPSPTGVLDLGNRNA